MSGKMSREKGKRVEYLVRDHMRSEGWEAHRVPSSGAAQGFKGDITACKEDKRLLLEVKARKNAFKALYKALDSLKTPTLGVWYQGIGIALSRSLSGAMDLDVFDAVGEPSQIPMRTLNKLRNMWKLLGTADMLIVKDDHKPLLFIRYVLPYGTIINKN